MSTISKYQYWKDLRLPDGYFRTIPQYGEEPFRPQKDQIRYFNSTSRFNIVFSGRRSGKTAIGRVRLVERAILLPPELPEGLFGIFAPTFSQVKLVYWKRIKQMVPEHLLKCKPNETTLSIEFAHNNATIQLFGVDKGQRAEGVSLVGGLLDEFGNMKPEVFSENIRPMSDGVGGYLDIIGVPEKGGFHYQELYEKALVDTSGDWSVFGWGSDVILPPEIIASAARDLDSETFRREYCGEWVEGQHGAYYGFSADNVIKTRVDYDPNLPLDISFDFNVEPSVCVICQTYPDNTTYVIDEVVIQRNGSTLLLAREIAKRYKNLRVAYIRIFGDMTGLNRHTSQTAGNDYDIIQSVLAHEMPYAQIRMPARRQNPLERNRLIVTNSRLRSHSGNIACFISATCKTLINDLKNVQRKSDGSLDKKYSPELTHISDALGYYLFELFGNKVNTARTGRRGMSTL